MGPVSPKAGRLVPVSQDRLDSWKEIAAFFNRDVRTVQRWERIWAMPVHRLPGGPKAGVYAFRSELDKWLETRGTPLAPETKRRIPLRRILWTGILALALSVTWYAAAVVRNPQGYLLSESRFTPFATSLAVQTCPAWSPNGKFVAFSSVEHGRSRLMIQALDSTTPVPITGPRVSMMGGGDPLWCRKPFWSSDSAAVYFLGVDGSQSGLFRVPVSGGEATLIQSGAVGASISPDGRVLAFLAWTDEKKLQVWTASPPDGERRVYQPPPFAAASLSNVPEISFRPDAREILAILTASGENQFWLMPWPPGPPRRVFRNAERAVGSPDASWMPDSRHIIFDAGGPLGMADTRNESYWPIAHQERPMRHPTPAPDGSRIAYQSSLSHAEIVAVPLGGGNVETLAGNREWQQMPTASPVTPLIAYVGANQNRRGLRIKNLTDGSDRLLVAAKDVRINGASAQLLMTPAFSSDGRRIAFGAVSPAGRAIFTVPATGGPLTPLVNGGGSPTWSPDDEWVAFRSGIPPNEQLLSKTRVSGQGKPVNLARICSSSMPEWSPTGEWIAFPGEKCETALINPEGGQPRKIGGSGTVVWSRDGRTLYRLETATHSLVAINIGSGEKTTLRDMGDLMPYSGPQPGLRASLTADGKRIVYSVLRPREEIWILEDVKAQEPWYAWILPFVRR